METFETRDLNLAACIYASGVVLDETRRDVGVCFFVFRDVGRCERLMRAYYNGEAMVSAKAYADALRTLKDLIFGGKYGAR
ncbi:MAG: DUF5659 domain-containing protein [Patescibacteria group bacterium]